MTLYILLILRFNEKLSLTFQEIISILLLVLGDIFPLPGFYGIVANESKYSRVDYIALNFLKAFFHEFYLVRS